MGFRWGMSMSFKAAKKPERKKSVIRTMRAWGFDDALGQSFGENGSVCAAAGECIFGSGEAPEQGE
jgi:hypothetical protein